MAMGTKLLAVCVVSVPDDIVMSRSQQREQRYEDITEDAAFIQKRLAEYQEGPAVVMKMLASEYPYYHIDGLQPVETNVAQLREIYLTHSSGV